MEPRPHPFHALKQATAVKGATSQCTRASTMMLFSEDRDPMFLYVLVCISDSVTTGESAGPGEGDVTVRWW